MRYYTKHSYIGLGFAALLFAVVSARMGEPLLAYGVVLCLIVAVVLCAWGRLPISAQPWLVYLFGAAFLFQATFISNGVVGTDVHTEYYFYLQSLDGWDTSIPHSYNASVGTTVIAPFLTHAFAIPGYWIYKAVFPAMFAIVPLIMYYIYRQEFGDKVAFIGAMLFVTLPTYILEMMGLPRQMLGELMLAVCLLLVVVRPISLRYSVPLLVVCATASFLFHYITGPAVAMYLGGGALILLIQRRRKFPVRWVALALVLSTTLGLTYYANMADGVILANLSVGSQKTVDRTVDALTEPPKIVNPIPSPSGATSPPTPATTYLHAQEPLIRTALGLDFEEATVAGKVFRILQIAMEIALVLGIWYLFRNRKRLSAEYLGFTVTALALIAACVFMPRFSNLVNVTRFYHLSLFLVSPLFIVGAMYVVRNLQWLTIGLIVPYMLFTTGVVFEAIQETDLTRINIPYSVALSNHRVGMVGTFTDNDIAVKDWAVANKCEPVFLDINGVILFSEGYDPFTYQYSQGKYAKEVSKGWAYFPKDVTILNEGDYLFLSERNMKTKTVDFKPDWYDMKDTATGMRQSYSFEFLNLPYGTPVYQSGNAILLKVGG